MELRLLRYSGGENTTLGILFLAGAKDILCYTLEDEERDVKIPSRTAIPIGRYKIDIADYGKNHAKYARRFPTIHKGMLRLQNVPGFTGIDIHIGNKDEDTAGCILVGESADLESGGDAQVLESSKVYLKIYPLILNALNSEEVWIEVYHRWGW